MIAGPVGINHERMEIAYLTQPYQFLRHHILYERPKLEPELAGLIRPFPTEVWVLIALATLIALFVLCLGSVALSQGARDPLRETRLGRVFGGLVSTTMWVLGILFGQSLAFITGGKSRRFMGGVWLLAALFVGFLYKCNLKAMLILPKVRIPFNSLEEMVGQDEFGWSIAGDNLLGTLLMTSAPDSLYGKVWAGNARTIRNYGDAFVALDHKEAIITETISSKMFSKLIFSRSGWCRTAAARQSFSLLYMLGTAVSPYAPEQLKGDASYIASVVSESGIWDHWINAAVTGNPDCFTTPDSNVKIELRPLILGDFYAVLLLYMAGMILSLMIFLLEILLSKC